MGRFLMQMMRRRPLAFGGLVVVLGYVAAAFLAPWLAPSRPDEVALGARLRPPAGFPGAVPGHPLGTDMLGRDILSRILYGAQISLAVGAGTVSVALVVGTVLGSVAGYFRGWVDQVLSRIADLLMAFPYLLFAILMMGILGPGLVNLILALSFKAWVEFFRVARGETLAEAQKEYVEAARALGCPPWHILIRHILPNIRHTLAVLAFLRLGYIILMEASLSFLGLGVPPHVPAWGSMVAAGRERLLDAWWVSAIPGMTILLLVVSINLLGEGLRDLMDPRLRGGGVT